MNIRRVALLVVALSLFYGLFGCAIGYNSVLFMTKSNVGLDVDTKPPTAEISIARREGVMAPTFEKGQTPPVMASFRVNTKGLIGIFANVSSTFAGGDAANTMSKLYGDPDATKPEDSTLCLKQKPTPRVLMQEISFPGEGEVKPFAFGTDTSLGLKIAWSGLTAQYPDTVKFGYNRKEFAFAPVFLNEEISETPCGKYGVKVPSFIATVDSSVNVKDPAGTSTGWLQYFATGTAATNLTLRKDVRKVMLERLDAEGAPEPEFAPDKYSECIIKWRDPDREKNNSRLREWMKINKVRGGITELIYAKDRAKVRPAVVTELQIPCN